MEAMTSRIEVTSPDGTFEAFFSPRAELRGGAIRELRYVVEFLLEVKITAGWSDLTRRGVVKSGLRQLRHPPLGEELGIGQRLVGGIAPQERMKRPRLGRKRSLR